MKLSDQTIEILKNLADINDSIVLKPGKTLKVIAKERNILAEVQIDEEIPFEIGIYGLRSFVAMATLDNPELELKEDHFVISDNELKTQFWYSALNLVQSSLPPEKSLEIEEPDAEFNLSQKMFTKLMKRADIMELPELYVRGNSEGLFIEVKRKGDPTSNFSTFKVSDYDGEDFECSMERSFLKILPGDYKVKVNKSGLTQFDSSDGKKKYWITQNTDDKKD